jgi:hypothetical protein
MLPSFAHDQDLGIDPEELSTSSSGGRKNNTYRKVGNDYELNGEIETKGEISGTYEEGYSTSEGEEHDLDEEEHNSEKEGCSSEDEREQYEEHRKRSARRKEASRSTSKVSYETLPNPNSLPPPPIENNSTGKKSHYTAFESKNSYNENSDVRHKRIHILSTVSLDELASGSYKLKIVPKVKKSLANQNENENKPFFCPPGFTNELVSATLSSYNNEHNVSLIGKFEGLKLRNEHEVSSNLGASGHFILPSNSSKELKTKGEKLFKNGLRQKHEFVRETPGFTKKNLRVGLLEYQGPNNVCHVPYDHPIIKYIQGIQKKTGKVMLKNPNIVHIGADKKKFIELPKSVIDEKIIPVLEKIYDEGQTEVDLSQMEIGLHFPTFFTTTNSEKNKQNLIDALKLNEVYDSKSQEITFNVPKKVEMVFDFEYRTVREHRNDI